MKIFIPVCSLFFHPLNGIFGRAKVFKCGEVCLSVHGCMDHTFGVTSEFSAYPEALGRVGVPAPPSPSLAGKGGGPHGCSLSGWYWHGVARWPHYQWAGGQCSVLSLHWVSWHHLTWEAEGHLLPAGRGWKPKLPMGSPSTLCEWWGSQSSSPHLGWRKQNKQTEQGGPDGSPLNVMFTVNFSCQEVAH